MATMYQLCENICRKVTKHINAFEGRWQCTSCQLPSMNGEIWCRHCHTKTQHHEVDYFTYDCKQCMRRQENVSFCVNCEERLAHAMIDNQAICINCGNDKNQQIEEVRDNEELEDNAIKIVNVVRTNLRITECRHGLHYADRRCTACIKEEGEAKQIKGFGGFSITKTVRIHKK